MNFFRFQPVLRHPWLLFWLLLLLFELEFDPSKAARETEDARKFRKVKVEMEPEESQRGSLSASL